MLKSLVSSLVEDSQDVLDSLSLWRLFPVLSDPTRTSLHYKEIAQDLEITELLFLCYVPPLTMCTNDLHVLNPVT